MAEMVQRVCPTRVDIAEGLANPRVEHEEHYFHAANTKLLDLGLQPHLLTDEVISSILELVELHRDRVDVRAIAPTVQWRSSASTLTTAGETGDSSFLAL
jgi:UDP-sulfoquinovose synthase